MVNRPMWYAVRSSYFEMTEMEVQFDGIDWNDRVYRVAVNFRFIYFV